MRDIVNNSGKKKLFTSSLSFLRWKWEGSGKHESAGNRADSFEDYFGFGFLLMHTLRDSSTHGSSRVTQEALPSKIVKAHRGPCQPQLCQGIKNILSLGIGPRNDNGLNTIGESPSLNIKEFRGWQSVANMGVCVMSPGLRFFLSFCSAIPGYMSSISKVTSWSEMVPQLKASRVGSKKKQGRTKWLLWSVLNPFICSFLEVL